VKNPRHLLTVAAAAAPVCLIVLAAYLIVRANRPPPVAPPPLPPNRTAELAELVAEQERESARAAEQYASSSHRLLEPSVLAVAVWT
jgi:hypothetical protein